MITIETAENLFCAECGGQEVVSQKSGRKRNVLFYLVNNSCIKAEESVGKVDKRQD